jgi:hypothetical protein
MNLVVNYVNSSIIKGTKMKNLLVILSFAIIAFSLSVYAQGRFTPQERLKMLKDRLSLTDEQSSKVEKILLKSDEDMKKLRANDNPDREAFMKIRDNADQEIQKVLNEKQKTEYNKMLEERRNRAGNRMGGNGNRQQQYKNNPNNN